MGLFSTPFSVFFFLSAASVALFSFAAVASWSNARRRERESYYKNEMLKKISETQGAGTGAALALLREENRLAAMRRQASLRIGGLVTASIGLALMIFLRALIRSEPVFLCGLIPLLPGLALFAGSYMSTGQPAAEPIP